MHSLIDFRGVASPGVRAAHMQQPACFRYWAMRLGNQMFVCLLLCMRYTVHQSCRWLVVVGAAAAAAAAAAAVVVH